MNTLERWCIRVRHHPALEQASFWNGVRPLYNNVIRALAGRRGLERIVNGTDAIRIAPEWRGIQEVYEPSVWERFTSDARPGDVVVDVGAFVGLYTIALAKRVGPHGSVVAFEPDPTNFAWLQRHVVLNRVQHHVTLVRAAVADRAGEAGFLSRDNESHLGDVQKGGLRVPVTTLDEEFPTQRVDLLKVDVEGHEEQVLRGGMRLLSDAARGPRTIYVEVHPYAWKGVGTSSESFLQLLSICGFDVSTLNGQPVVVIDRYEEIVAQRRVGPSSA